MTEATYEELISRGRELLVRDETVILDATRTSAPHREAAVRAADEACSAVVPLRCEAPLDVVRERVHGRGPDASDAAPEIAEELAECAGPWPDAVALDTDRRPGAVLADPLDEVGRYRLHLNV